MIQKVFSQIDKLNDTYVDIWEDVCNLESPSTNKEAVDKVSTYFRKIAERQGWVIEEFQQKRFGNVLCITMNPEGKLPTVALSGHLDTVHPIGSCGTPAVRREGDIIHAPGAMDCKGGVVAGFLAMEALRLCGYTDRPIMMLLQVNEEVGSGLTNKEPINYICQKAKDVIAFLNLEGHEAHCRDKATLIRKGITGFCFKVQGVEAHASCCAKEGASAILEAAHKIVEIEKIKDSDGATCNCGIITGGSATNTVPGSCEFRVDVRFSTQEQYRQTIAQLQKISDTVYVPGCSCTMEQTNLRPAMELSDQNVRLLNKVNELFAQNGLSQLKIGTRTGASDASNVASAGIPCLDSLGVEGEHCHTIYEYGIISSLAESAKRVASIIYGL